MKTLKKQIVILSLVLLAFQLTVLRNIGFAATAGDVVINEISWAGTSDNYNDEWIELYNTTSQSIDLTGWKIEDDLGSSVYGIASGQIAAHGYFLIEDNELATNKTTNAIINLSLANTGDSLVLKDAGGSVIDTVNGSGGMWYAGNAETKATMERVNSLVREDSSNNWLSALSGNGATGRSGGVILGTPGGLNSTTSSEGGPEVNLISSSSSPASGTNVTLTANISNANDLYAYGFEIIYDPEILSYVNSEEKSFLKADGSLTAFSAALENGLEGTLLVGDARLANPVSGVDGNGELFTATFEVIGGNGETTNISFSPNSYLSDTVQDIAARYSPVQLTILSDTVPSVTNAGIAQNTERYSLKLTWQAPATGADKYIIKRKSFDGTFTQLAEVTALEFIDNNKIIPTLDYQYQIIAVKGTRQAPAVTVTGKDNRGVKGDLNRSDRVDGKDIELLARSYGALSGDVRFDALKDLNFDGVIDGSDLIDIGMNFGLKY